MIKNSASLLTWAVLKVVSTQAVSRISKRLSKVGKVDLLHVDGTSSNEGLLVLKGWASDSSVEHVSQIHASTFYHEWINHFVEHSILNL